jgi:hypothetical protein
MGAGNAERQPFFVLSSVQRRTRRHMPSASDRFPDANKFDYDNVRFNPRPEPALLVGERTPKGRGVFWAVTRDFRDFSVDEWVKQRAPEARFVGSGTYGAVYSISGQPAVALARVCTEGGGRGMLTGGPDGLEAFKRDVRAGRDVAVKVQLLFNDAQVEDAHYETMVHARLCAGVRMRPHMARLYFGATALAELDPTLLSEGILKTAAVSPKVALRVTFMELLDGYVPLWKYPAQGSTHEARAGVYRSVRSMLATLWAAGYFHGDLHAGNVLVPATGIVDEASPAKLIDLGFALRVSPGTRDACSRAADADGSVVASMALASRSGGPGPGPGPGPGRASRLRSAVGEAALDQCVALVEADILSGIKQRRGNPAAIDSDPHMLRALRLWVVHGNNAALLARVGVPGHPRSAEVAAQWGPLMELRDDKARRQLYTENQVVHRSPQKGGSDAGSGSRGSVSSSSGTLRSRSRSRLRSSLGTSTASSGATTARSSSLLKPS